VAREEGPGNMYPGHMLVNVPGGTRLVSYREYKKKRSDCVAVRQPSASSGRSGIQTSTGRPIERRSIMAAGERVRERDGLHRLRGSYGPGSFYTPAPQSAAAVRWIINNVSKDT